MTLAHFIGVILMFTGAMLIVEGLTMRAKRKREEDNE